MDVRHLATKYTNGAIEFSKSVVFNGVPMCINIEKHRQQSEIVLEKSTSKVIEHYPTIESNKSVLLESPIGDILRDSRRDKEVKPMSKLFDFKVGAGTPLHGVVPDGASFEMILEDPNIAQFMRVTAGDMFPEVNPETGERDLNISMYYARYIPLVIYTGVMTPQMKDDKVYFNGEGTVSVAEFLDSLNAINYGCNSNNSRKKTIDNISDEDDYFNEGYQSCCRGVSSPFFNLYTRKELTEPITRIEAAYITVICWENFMKKFNSITDGSYYLGINFDWENPAKILSRFDDGFDYKISKVSLDNAADVISLDIKDYKGETSMHDYKDDLKSGICAIPLPMFMSLLELYEVGLLRQVDSNLDPMKELSRGELCFFVTMLAKLFTMPYYKVNY